jgi:hypothetical protein
MSDDATPDLRDLMAEALTTTFTGHPQRRFQALAANRVLAERMWPPVKAALDERDASLAESRTARDSLRNRIRELEQVCAGCMTREQQRDSAMEAARLNGVKTEEAKAAWYREKNRADEAERDRHRWRARAEQAEAERDQTQATLARVREAIKDERAAARRIVDEGRDQGGAWVNLMHSCAMFLMAFEPTEPTDPIKAHLDQQPPAVCTCSSDLMSIHDCAVHGADLRCSPGCRIHGQRGELS